MERISSYSSSSAWDKIKTQYVYDGRGSVAQELSNNNSWYTFGGALAKTTKTSYSYTPFGELLNSTTAKTTNYAYNGESYDSATGMVNLRARWYEPATMRFNQRDTWSGKLEKTTTENRYLYCMNDPIGYYDRGGDRADEGSGVPKKVTPSTSAKKVVATPKTPTPTPTPKTTPLPQPAPSPDTKLNANTAAKKSSNTLAKVLIGVVTVAVCIGIIAVSGGTATPVLGAAAPGFLEIFAANFTIGTAIAYGNSLIQQIDRTDTFRQASDNAAAITKSALPYIAVFSGAGAGASTYANSLTGGQIPSHGLKPAPFAASAFDDALDDVSGAYSGTQANGATQSGSAGTTACTAEQITGEWHHIASDKSLVSGYTAQYEKIFKNAGMTLQDNENLMFLQNHSGEHTVAYKQYVLDYIEYATKGLSGSAAKEALTSALGQLKDQLIANPLMPYRGGMN